MFVVTGSLFYLFLSFGKLNKIGLPHVLKISNKCITSLLVMAELSRRLEIVQKFNRMVKQLLACVQVFFFWE